MGAPSVSSRSVSFILVLDVAVLHQLLLYKVYSSEGLKNSGTD